MIHSMQRGLTLIELMVVVAVLAILASALPVLLVGAFLLLQSVPGVAPPPPERDFVAAGYYHSSGSPRAYKLEFEVRDGRLHGIATPVKTRDGQDQMRVNLFRYDARENRITEIDWNLPEGLSALEEPLEFEPPAILVAGVSDVPPPPSVDLALRARAYTVQEITPEIAELSTNLAGEIGTDPADRLIAASSILGNAPVVTADRRMRNSSLLETVW